LIPEGSSVLELGARDPAFLAELKPARGLAVFDAGARSASHALLGGSSAGVEIAAGDIESPAYLAEVGGGFDFVLVRDVLVWLRDCESFLLALREVCSPTTRVIFVSHSVLWRPLIRLSQIVGLTPRASEENVISPDSLRKLCSLADLRPCYFENRQLSPFRMVFLGPLINRLVAPLPLIRRLNLRWYATYRPAADLPLGSSPSVSIVVPARNESGNIKGIVERVPALCEDMELIFVEGNSSDDTHAQMLAQVEANPELRIRVLQQDGTGKYDAVKKGFGAAEGDVLMILDADMTVPPEDLPRFYRAIRDGKGEMVMGTRLVYPLEDQSMRFLNVIANKLFSKLFSWMLGQPITDTLCGTKVMSRSAYERIAAGRDYFGDFDPFGDFDLIFGAARLQLEIVEIPIRYREREWGETQISRFRNGLTLFRMVGFAYRRFKVS